MAASKVWLDGDVATADNGNLRMLGTWGHRSLAVELDPSIYSHLFSDAERVVHLRTRRREIEAAAAAHLASGNKNTITEVLGEVDLVAVTSQDLG